MTHDQTAGTAANTGPACIHDDVMTLRELAQTIKAHPTQKAAAAAFEAVVRIADDLAHRLDAIEAAAAQAKPCEGCGGGEAITAEEMSQVQAIGGELWEVINKHEPSRAEVIKHKMGAFLAKLKGGA